MLESGDIEQINALQASYYGGTMDGMDLSVLVGTEFTLPGTEVTAVVVDTENYDLADGSGKAMITWQTKDIVAISKTMNTTHTNTGGWDASDMRKYLNGYDSYASSGSYIGTLSPDVANSLKTVKVVASKGGGTDPNKSTPVTSADKLFLPAGTEVFGKTGTFARGGTNAMAQCSPELSLSEDQRYLMLGDDLGMPGFGGSLVLFEHGIWNLGQLSDRGMRRTLDDTPALSSESAQFHPNSI